jgi:SAM-dependent methyltransferase
MRFGRNNDGKAAPAELSQALPNVSGAAPPQAVQVAPGAPTGTSQSHLVTAAAHLWARVFAAVYNPFLWFGERAGMRRYRRELLARARGQTLEIGSGTGLNLDYFPKDLEGLVLAEPDPSMRRRLMKAVHRSGRPTQVSDAAAEHLIFADATFDTVVSTLVLCTVDDPDLALREIRRVLRPGGQLLFIEHVRSDAPSLARWQDRLSMPWQHLAEGCRCNRRTLGVMDAAGFRLDTHAAVWRAMPSIVRPLVIGCADLGARYPSMQLEQSTSMGDGT